MPAHLEDADLKCGPFGFDANNFAGSVIMVGAPGANTLSKEKAQQGTQLDLTIPSGTIVGSYWTL